MYTQGHLKQAVDLGVALANRFPTNSLIPNILGATYAALENYYETVNNYNRALELEPDYAEVYNNFGAALNEFKEYDEAIKRLNKAIEFKSDFAEAHNNLGNALRELNQIEKARESYEKAIQFKPDFAEAHNNLGNTLIDLGKLEEAAQFLIDEASKIESVANTLSEGIESTLKIAVDEVFPQHLLYQALSHINEQYPLVKIELIDSGLDDPMVSLKDIVLIPILLSLNTHSLTRSRFHGSPYGFPKHIDK